MTFLIREDLIEEYNKGQRLGGGCSRTAKRIERGTVVKHGSRNANKMEWNIWNTVKDTEFAQYFVPVLAHSEDFDYIEVPFAEDVDWYDRKDTVHMRCKLISDQHRSNWGIYDGRICIRDYEYFYDQLEDILKPKNWELHNDYHYSDS